MGPPKREPSPNQPQPPAGGASTYPPPHNTAAGFVESSAQQVVAYGHMQQQYDHHDQTAAQPHDHHQFQQHQPPPQPAAYPPAPPQYTVAGNPTYDHQQPQQQMSDPPPVVQFPPPSPTNMPQPQHQTAPPPSYPSSNNNGGVASFPPQQNGHNASYYQSPHQNGYNMNMNNGMPPQKRVAYQPQPSPVNGIPMSALPAGTPVAGWKTGLFDCMDDPMNAIITAFFPCLTFGQVAEIVDGGHTSCGTSGMLYGLIAFFLGVPFIMSCTYRTKMRSMFGLAESPAPDWVTHFLCEWCALCQEYRELQLRGYDPSIGWLGNQALRQNQQQQQLAMAPPINQRMMH